MVEEKEGAWNCGRSWAVPKIAAEYPNHHVVVRKMAKHSTNKPKNCLFHPEWVPTTGQAERSSVCSWAQVRASWGGVAAKPSKCKIQINSRYYLGQDYTDIQVQNTVRLRPRYYWNLTS